MPPPESIRRRLPRTELVLLAAAGVWALWFQLSMPGRLAPEADYSAAARHLAEHAEPGDVVLLHPWWTERARLYLPPQLPVVGYLGSDAADLTRHARIWVLEEPELPLGRDAEFERLFSPRREAIGAPSRFGHLQLSLFRNGRHRPVLFSAADALSGARVHLEGPGGERQDCPLQGTSFRCPGGPNVETAWHEVHFEPRRCVFVPPPAGGKKVVVELPPVPPSDSLDLEAGLIWDRGFFHDPGLSPAHVSVADPSGREVMDLAVPVGVEGVQKAEVPGGAPGPRPLSISVEARNPELRDLCVDLFAYGPLGGARG